MSIFLFKIIGINFKYFRNCLMPSQKSHVMKTDLVSDLPNEICEIIFFHLSLTTLLYCRRVSKSWKQIVDNDNIWRSKFKDQKSWKYYNHDSEIDSWYELCKNRHLLELNWKNDNFKMFKFFDTPYEAASVKLLKNWIITGSYDGTIKIWDIETSQCLRVLGEPNHEILKHLGVSYYEILIDNFKQMEVFELIKNIDYKFHLGVVVCIDINDQYLVSGSWDGSCIIWKLPDLKPIDRLIIPGASGLFINDVALYNDYIVCCNEHGYIGVWKSNFDNFEHLLRFNLLYCLKGDIVFDSICIHDGIIYSKGYNAVRTWNIETGQIIQKFRYNDKLFCMTLIDQNLFVGERNKITVWELQSSKLVDILSDQRVHSFCINDDKIVSLNNTGFVKIWNLNDQKLLKVYSKPYLHTISSFYADSKRMVVFTTGCDIIFYDFTQNLRKKYLKHF